MNDATAVLTGDNGGTGAGAASQGTGEQAGAVWGVQFDEDTGAYVNAKGWKSPTDLLTSYRNLEKFAGGSKNLLELPGDNASEDVLNQFYSRLGRPDAAEKYGFDVPEGGDPELTNWFKQTAFKHGLSQKQAQSLFNDWNGMSGSLQEKLAAEKQAASERDMTTLKSEWGQNFDKMIGSGKMAVRALGLDEAKLASLEDKLGSAEMLRLFATLGSKMGEDTFEGGERSGSSFGLDPAAARQQISDLKMDKEFMSQYLAGNQDAVAKMRRLMEAAHG